MSENQVAANEPEELEDDSNVEIIPVFDTTNARKKRHVEIDGVTYEIRPLGSAEYFRIVDKSRKLNEIVSGKQNSKAVRALQDELFPLIIPLFEPSETFNKWIVDTKRDSGFAYRSIMQELVKLVVPNVRKADKRA